MVYDLQKGMNALSQLYNQLLAGTKADSDKVKSNENQLNMLGSLINELVNQRNPNQGLVPNLEGTKGRAASQHPDAIIRAYRDSKDAKKSILQVGKDYISKARGELQHLLIGIFSHLYGQYSMSYRQAKYTANGPMIKPEVAKQLKDDASILK